MSTQLTFDLLQFEPLTKKKWIERYRSSIRVICNPKKCTKATCELLPMTEKMEVYGVWYSGGNFMDGKPKRLKLGNSLTLARIPAIGFGNRYLIVNGMHRMTDIKPRWVLLDVLRLSLGEEKYFIDLQNNFWKGN